MALASLLLDFGAIPAPVDIRYEGAVNVYNLGWFTWSFGHTESTIKPINFESAIFFADAPNILGVNTYMAHPATYHYELKGKDGTALGIKIGDALLNFPTGAVDAIARGLSFHRQTVTFADGPEPQLPVSSAPNHMEPTDPIPVGWSKAVTGLYGKTLKPGLIVLQFASEIAQWTVMRDQNTDVDSNILHDGFNHPSPSSGVIRYIDIALSATPTQTMHKFGKTGLFKVGALSFEYDGYYSELQYINNVSQRFFPPAPGATGVGVWLAKGIHGSYNLGYVSDFALAMNTTLGEIGLLAGKINPLIH